MMSLVNPVAISMETPRIKRGCSLKKEFSELIYMNLQMVLYLVVNKVDSCNNCVYGLLT